MDWNKLEVIGALRETRTRHTPGLSVAPVYRDKQTGQVWLSPGLTFSDVVLLRCAYPAEEGAALLVDCNGGYSYVPGDQIEDWKKEQESFLLDAALIAVKGGYYVQGLRRITELCAMIGELRRETLRLHRIKADLLERVGFSAEAAELYESIQAFRGTEMEVSDEQVSE